MTKIELLVEVDKLKPWYHKILLTADDGEYVLTPGEPFNEIWDNIEDVIDGVNYEHKSVLDLACFDGKWSFYAETKGASIVVATDCNWKAYANFMLCRKARNSKVLPLFNVPAHEIVNRLDSYLVGRDVGWKPHDGKEPIRTSEETRFDIVQHLGLLYHLRDPMQSLLQARSCLVNGGLLILETAHLNSDQPIMQYNPSGEQWKVYDDATTWWAPSIPCLIEMLRDSMFIVKPETVSTLIREKDSIGRVALVAEAVTAVHKDMDPYRLTELLNKYRTPGLDLWAR
jgi:SAM-dependent methyltransferase